MHRANLLNTIVVLGFWGMPVLGAPAERATLRPVARVRLYCVPTVGLMNEVVSVRVSGLAPSTRVTLVAETVVLGRWRARGTFVTNQAGEINLDHQAPIDGTYKGIDGMGLFVSGEAVRDATAQEPSSPDPGDPITTTFSIVQEGRHVAAGSCVRRFMPSTVQRREIRKDGLVGDFFIPTGAGRHPALLVLGGSEGGIDQLTAAGLAARGYAALALAYFRMPSLPGELVNIPLEYPLKAIAWLRNQVGVDPDRVGIYGASRGAELALVLASKSPEVRVVVAFAPSSVTWAGSGRQNAGRPAWTLGGHGLPTVSVPFTLDSFRAVGTHNDASIQVEHSRAAMFLVSGGQDRIWPIKVAPIMGDMIVARLKEHRYPFVVEHWSYSGGGHSIRMFYLPSQVLSSGGGTPSANAAAVADLTPKLFMFLGRYLSQAIRQPPVEPFD